MTIFAIDAENTITAYLAGESIPEDHATFSSEKELTKLAAAWPMARFVEVWNNFAEVPPFGDLKPVKKFTDRKSAITRIWRAIQALTPTPAPTAAPAAPAPKRKATKATIDTEPREARPGSKKAIVLDLLRRPEGATLEQIMSATGWQSHSVRGFLSGSLGKKMGLAIESLKTDDGARAYRLPEAQA
ncbi:MAG: DUF3489 domain-containing protein [Bryobacteraceae bacterium]|nr:DUF3489 domain-containing protein [Bryobacteraceae bacterium]